ncbi:hemin uptake protein HemP [Methylobacterium brachythecii]|uniref:Hemin uptake protein HemP n=1 Tax=Methylobacterium brachythecii TaxID=1176177 RepID=A0A7W6AGT4_9HYPH|nr:hemin uptake protein HemP [Methylobacterium brachythecii]MBB3900736.1 hemin uptake protein HemP [Methylobacterium brachythecii]
MKPGVPEIKSDDLSKDENTAATSGDESFATGGVVESVSLMKGRRQLTIVHGNERYQLRVTTNDKLILTK